jgi:hypothetical protein
VEATQDSVQVRFHHHARRSEPGKSGQFDGKPIGVVEHLASAGLQPALGLPPGSPGGSVAPELRQEPASAGLINRASDAGSVRNRAF